MEVGLSTAGAEFLVVSSDYMRSDGMMQPKFITNYYVSLGYHEA